MRDSNSPTVSGSSCPWHRTVARVIKVITDNNMILGSRFGIVEATTLWCLLTMVPEQLKSKHKLTWPEEVKLQVKLKGATKLAKNLWSSGQKREWNTYRVENKYFSEERTPETTILFCVHEKLSPPENI